MKKDKSAGKSTTRTWVDTRPTGEPPNPVVKGEFGKALVENLKRNLKAEAEAKAKSKTN